MSDPNSFGQRFIVPMMAFMEDDRRSRKAVPTRIAGVDCKPMGVAVCGKAGPGRWRSHHQLYPADSQRQQPPENEKRMVAVLNESAYDAWLGARLEKAKEFMQAYPANLLFANPVEKEQ